jgi:hypothetical protein
MAFPGGTPAVVLDAILNRVPASAVPVNPELPPKLEELITKALEKDRNLRYQHASDIRTDLQRLKRSSQSDGSPVSPKEQVFASKRKLWKIFAPAFLFVLAAAGLYFYFHRRPALTDKDTIVIADFANTTGDSVFDGALRQGLAVQLQQSPFLQLVSEEQIQHTLLLMGQSPDARLTAPLAREVCQRTESAAVIDGSITSLGSQYVLGLQAINCPTGESLAGEQVVAPRKEQVLGTLGDASTQLRRKLGESLSSVQKFDTPLEQATTTSLEALQSYSVGIRTLARKGDDAAAIPFFEPGLQRWPLLGFLVSTRHPG